MSDAMCNPAPLAAPATQSAQPKYNSLSEQPLRCYSIVKYIKTVHNK